MESFNQEGMGLRSQQKRRKFSNILVSNRNKKNENYPTLGLDFPFAKSVVLSLTLSQVSAVSGLMSYPGESIPFTGSQLSENAAAYFIVD